MSVKSTVSAQRNIQQQVERADARHGDGESGAMQAGARRYPEPPFPRQHQAKPGDEARLDPPPMYEAPYYRGSRKLEDKVALITGGDSGIGRAVAVLYAREGADVAIAHIAEDRDAADTAAAVEAEGRRCLVLKGDVRERDFCRRTVADTLREFGRLDVLVNNAAFQVHAATIEDLTPEHFAEKLKTNLYGYIWMAQAATPHMKPGAAIVNTGSIIGIDGSKALLDYSMTKGGIHAFTRALAGQSECRAASGSTPWRRARSGRRSTRPTGRPMTWRSSAAGTKMKRPAQPEEIAPAYVFLASPHCSSYITGEVLPIIGGY